MMGVEAGQGVLSVVFDWSSAVSKRFLFCKAIPFLTLQLEKNRFLTGLF